MVGIHLHLDSCRSTQPQNTEPDVCTEIYPNCSFRVRQLRANSSQSRNPIPGTLSTPAEPWKSVFPASAAQAGRHKEMQELFAKAEWSSAEHRAARRALQSSSWLQTLSTSTALAHFCWFGAHSPRAPSGTAACGFYILFVSGEGAGVAVLVCFGLLFVGFINHQMH